MASPIEDIIDDIESYIDGCKPVAFSSSKVAVNRETLENLLEELRSRTPVEIRQYQKVISNQESILADARRKADAIIAQAEIKTNELLSENQIMQQAYAQANEVVMIASKNAEEVLSKATNDANNIRSSAIEYTDSLLKNVQDVIYGSMDTTRSRMESYLSTMQGYLDTVVSNRMELAPKTEEPQKAETKEQQNAAQNHPKVDDKDHTSSEDAKEGTGEKPEEVDVPEKFFHKE